MKDESRPNTEKQTRKRSLKSAEELAAIWSRGIDIWIVVAEFAGLLRVSTGWVYLKLHENPSEIPHCHLGRYPRFKLSDCMAYIEKIHAEGKETLKPKPGRSPARDREAVEAR